MSNAFPKSYIIERIAARKASLQSKVDAGAKAASDWDEFAREKLILQLDQMVEKAAKTLDKAKESAKASRDLHSDDLYHAVQQAGTTPSISPFPSVNMGGVYGYRDYEQKYNAMRKLRDEGNAAERELDKLEHAEAYFVETPVDEFTITGLKQLGLLDAVKFDLGAVSK